MASVAPVLKIRLSRLFILLPFFHLSLAFAQQDSCLYSVGGRVLDIESREPVPYVTVQVADQKIGTITDQDGFFEIRNICRQEFDLVVSHVGYKPARHHHDPYHESPTILLATSDKWLESVVVEGEYNPADIKTLHINQLSETDLVAGKSGSFGDLAGRIAGVSTISTGQNIVKPVIHGLHSNRVLIINNGVRHEFQNWGVEHAPEIDPSMAGSLEVVKGAATVRYGPDALGGVILINPPKPELSSGLKGAMELVGQSNGRSAEGNLELSHGWKSLVLAAQGSAVRQGDLSTPGYQLTNTGKEENSLVGSVRYHRGNFDLEGYFSRFYQNLGILRGSVNGNLKDLAHAMESDVPPDTRPFAYTINTPRQEVVHHLAKLKGSCTLENQDFSFQYAYQLNHRQEFDVRRGTNNETPSINLELATHTLDLDWNHPEFGPFEGTVGVQWLYQDNNNIPGTNTVPFVPNYNNIRAGLFAIERINRDKISYEAGIRYDFQYSSIRGRDSDNSIYRNELTYSQVTGSLGLTKELAEGLDLRSNLGLAWRPPNISELYSYGKHQAAFEYGLWRSRDGLPVDGVLSEADMPVKSEMGVKWITSLANGTPSTDWEITGYVNLIKNYFYNRPAGITNSVRGAFPYFIYVQSDVLFWGVDAGWKRDVGEFWEINAQGNYLWAKEIVTGDKLVGIPPARVSMSWSCDRKPDFLSESRAGIELSYVFRYFQQPRTVTPGEIEEAQANGQNLFTEDASSFDFMDAPDGYLLANFYWSGSKGPFSWIFQVKNLFNASYRSYTDRLRYFADEAGRNMQLSIRYSIR